MSLVAEEAARRHGDASAVFAGLNAGDKLSSTSSPVAGASSDPFADADYAALAGLRFGSASDASDASATNDEASLIAGILGAGERPAGAGLHPGGGGDGDGGFLMTPPTATAFVDGAGDGNNSTTSVSSARPHFCWEGSSSSSLDHSSHHLHHASDHGYGSGSGALSPEVRPPSAMGMATIVESGIGGGGLMSSSSSFTAWRGRSPHDSSPISSSSDGSVASSSSTTGPGGSTTTDPLSCPLLEMPPIRLGPLIGQLRSSSSESSGASPPVTAETAGSAIDEGASSGRESASSPSPPAVALANALLNDDDDDDAATVNTDQQQHPPANSSCDFAKEIAASVGPLCLPDAAPTPSSAAFLDGVVNAVGLDQNCNVSNNRSSSPNSNLAANLAALAKLNEIQQHQQQQSSAAADANYSLVSTEFVNAGMAAATAAAAAAVAATAGGGGSGDVSFGGYHQGVPPRRAGGGGGSGRFFQQHPQMDVFQPPPSQHQLGRSMSMPADAHHLVNSGGGGHPGYGHHQHAPLQQQHSVAYGHFGGGHHGGVRHLPNPYNQHHHQQFQERPQQQHHQMDFPPTAATAADWNKLAESVAAALGRSSPYSALYGAFDNGGGFSVNPAGSSSSSSSSTGSAPGGNGGVGVATNQMQIRCKFGQLGNQPGMFNAPHGFCLGRNEEVVVADTNNHRVQIFDTNGQFLHQFGHAGKEEGCLWYPRKVAVLKRTGNFVVCDRGGERSRMQIFSPDGHFLRKIAIRFIDIVAGLAISRDDHIVAVDSVTPTVFFISEGGRLISYLECSDFMTEPSDIAVFGSEYYICDFKGHSVVVIDEQGRLLRRIGCESVTPFPNGIDISDAGDVLIGDSHGNQFHVAVYSNTGNQLLSQFTCPNVKVSRCCGLKITANGYVVTLAKNNHHVLVLNTLYVS